jgi:hypothetical protein
VTVGFGVAVSVGTGVIVSVGAGVTVGGTVPLGSGVPLPIGVGVTDAEGSGVADTVGSGVAVAGGVAVGSIEMVEITSNVSDALRLTSITSPRIRCSPMVASSGILTNLLARPLSAMVTVSSTTKDEPSVSYQFISTSLPGAKPYR